MANTRRKIDFNDADFAVVREVGLQFPGTHEDVSHEGTPSLKIRGRLLARLHESGEFISIHIGFPNRERFLETYPEVFHLPEHFIKYPYMAMWINAAGAALIKEVLECGWRGLASQRQIKEWEGR